MSVGDWFLRIAEPMECWDSASRLTVAEAAHQLGQDASWSLFVCSDELFAREVMGAYHGSRTGRGPLHDVAYVRLTRESIDYVSGAILEHSPHNFTFGWPTAVADAHHDLAPMSEERALPLLLAGRGSLVRLSRIELLTEQIRLLRRPDCTEQFRSSVGQRLRKLSLNERPVFEALVRSCDGSAIGAPASEDFRP